MAISINAGLAIAHEALKVIFPDDAASDLITLELKLRRVPKTPVKTLLLALSGDQDAKLEVAQTTLVRETLSLLKECDTARHSVNTSLTSDVKHATDLLKSLRGSKMSEQRPASATLS